VGSSGSPIFNAEKRLVGTHTGGSSCCTTNGCGQGTSLQSPDFYGKMSFHFGSGNPNPPSERLSAWLSPVGSPSQLEGSRNPCAGIGFPESVLPRLNIAPNPASSAITISLDPFDRGAARLRITDLSGRLVLERPIRGGIATIEVASIPDGMYLLALSVDDRQVAIERMVIEH